ncbi:MAG TPA: hydroxymyristoyl-ACP dehydratase [Gammaproteobacteria bacterium]
MGLSREELCRCVPHAGSMCLLNEVLRWDAERIYARATNHNDTDHPLRHADHLPALCAIEYAAQAMAVHGALMAQQSGGAPRIGFIGSVRDVRLRVAHLDGIAAPLEIEAVKQLADDNHSLYELHVSAGGKELMSGRAAVFLQSGEK